MNTAIKVVSEFFSKRGQSATSDLHVLLSNHPILVYIMYTCIYIYMGVYLNSIDLKTWKKMHSTDQKWFVSPGRRWMPRPGALRFSGHSQRG